MAQNGAKAWEYPWGDWKDGYANTGEAGLGRATAVGMYPHGAAACGALDVAGNLFEWCLNDYDDPQIVAGYSNGESKALRGGSFHFSRNNAACASRFSNRPLSRFDNFGLRVVSPIT